MPVCSASARASAKACRAAGAWPSASSASTQAQPGDRGVLAGLCRCSDLQRRARQRLRPWGVALAPRQRRQRADREALDRPITVGPQQLQRRVECFTGSLQRAAAEPCRAQVRQADGFVDAVAGLAAYLQRLLAKVQLAHQLTSLVGGDRQQIEQPRLQSGHPEAACLGQTLQCQFAAGVDLALIDQRHRQRAQRVQPLTVITSPRGARHAAA